MILPIGLATPYVLDNGKIQLSVDPTRGTYDLAWSGGPAMRGVVGEVRLPTGVTLRTDASGTHTLEATPVADAFGRGTRVVVRHRTPRGPELRQTFWVYGDRPEAMVRLDLVGATGSNSIAPIVTETPLMIPHPGPLRSLFVPWDNDMYFRYRSDGWGEGDGDGDGSYEVGAVWDDTTRNALVVGSVDHDLWKSAVRFRRDAAGGVAGLRAFAGVTSKYTHDSEPHGIVRGKDVRSPRMLIGWYGDWREGMERYGDVNAIIRPALPWKGTVPFAWNSWSGHKTKVNAEHARVATDFIDKEIPEFRSGGTAYVNFDSYWSNLNQAQLLAFVKRAHDAGLKTGIYWTPFACWGGLDRKIDPGSPYTFRDICLKDATGVLLPQLDTAYPIDPTHPGTLKHIDLQMKRFVDLGFDYVKLDFLSHGAIEGKHYNSKVPTGTAAYAVGMKRIVDDLAPAKIGRPFFISLSIAPMFPHGFAHSRRISCDVFANIGASEYLMNSANYGWWPGGRLYRFNDPDSATVYQPMDEPPVTEAEARTRFTASVVAGGMMIQGDDLTKPEARARALEYFRNREVLDVALPGVPFRPIDGDTGFAAGDAFVRKDGAATLVAVFNYSKDATKRRTIPLARLGMSERDHTIRDLWAGTESFMVGDLVFDLPPMSCRLVRVTPMAR